MTTQKETIQLCINMCLKVIRMYDWMLDLFVLDFFVDDHWNKLPLCWRESFQNTDPQQLGRVLSGKPTNKVYPLSLLALISSVEALGIPRESNLHQKPESYDGGSIDRCRSHPKLKNLFLKHVKLKKRHEISLMARVVDGVAEKSGCGAVIDFGSGLGHLVRMLAYKYELYAAGIECQMQLTEEARKLDYELEYTANKYLTPKAMSKLRRPIHINTTLQSDQQLLELSLPETIKCYGLIGLHPCGDLGPLLLKQFVNNPNVQFICVVGCCFMKLTCGHVDNGYPMICSIHFRYCRVAAENLTIPLPPCPDAWSRGEALLRRWHRVVALYSLRLALAPLVETVILLDRVLFVLERGINVEYNSIPLPPSPDAWSRGEALLRRWHRVVALYSLRLALAPLVETVILLDRVLFVLERGINVE
ncbi:Protein RRNAD1 [Operophtera brumata]|uniref:Protein RRNAD1 n=1 Tax=Operophtera brumata TaxID=104452 RepID=A0A0L7L9P1_OPEBR|nr:Protein RRNAD1 [Operophtera brumata]